MKKKLMMLVSLIVITLLVFEIYSFGKSNKLYYVALGDSLAEGRNPYGEIGYSYTDYLKENLENHQRLAYYTKEYAKSGYTSEDILNDIKANNKLKKDLRESDLVTISVGANDLLKEIDLRYLDTSKLLKLEDKVDEIIPKIDDCLKEVRKYAKEEIIVVGYYNPIPLLFNSGSYYIDKIFAYIDEEYSKLATKYDSKYISLYQLFKNHRNYLPNPDDIHPNIEGYESIANKIIDEEKI